MASTGCHQQEGQEAQSSRATPSALHEVILPSGSSKRGYLKEAEVSLTDAPLMEPLTGTVTYDEAHTVRITSPVAGRVISNLPALGGPVAPGTALVELDSPDLGQAKEDFANAEPDQRLAESAYQRAKMLFDGSVLPRKDLQLAEDNLARARNETQRTRLRLHNLGVDEKGIDDRFAIRSPIAGLITERHVNTGMEVRPDLPDPLFVISDLSNLWVLMDVFEKDLTQMHVGKKLQVRVPAYPQEAFPAIVDYIDKRVDPATHTVKVRCLLPNPAGKLLPAMYASVELQNEAADRAIVVPLSALFTEGEGDSVFVVIGDGHYQRREVKIKLRLKDRAVIGEGLQPGERIVSEGALLLRTEEANEEDAGAARSKP